MVIQHYCLQWRNNIKVSVIVSVSVTITNTHTTTTAITTTITITTTTGIVQMLLELGADVQCKTSWLGGDLSPLHCACMECNDSMVSCSVVVWCGDVVSCVNLMCNSFDDD